MRETIPPVPVLDGLRVIADRYEGFILDLWGVLHDGVRPYPGAIESLRQLKRRAKRVVILSNAPRRAAPVARRMHEIGIASELYDGLHSSGEETWRLLRERTDPTFAALGRRYFPLMPERDRGLIEGLDLEAVDTSMAAEFVLVTGLADAAETVADYERPLATAARLARPMVCANPDLEVVRNGVRELCAGALALRYEALGGTVHYVGKPHPAVYRRCFGLLPAVARPRILAVGDSLRTDVAGADGVGIDSLLVTGGIHATELAGAGGLNPDPTKLAAACANAGQRPTYAVAGFTW
ncbi:MAG: TIGR01459 family HAD-type hydrolase [Gemmatimonadales bacterium]